MNPNRPVIGRSHPFNNYMFSGKRLRERQPAGILFLYGLGGGTLQPDSVAGSRVSQHLNLL
jgi:hypothetical protein